MPLFDRSNDGRRQPAERARRFALLHEAISATMSRFYKARDLHSGKIVGLKLLDAEKTAAFEARFKGLGKPSRGRDRRPVEASRGSSRPTNSALTTEGRTVPGDGVPRRGRT